MLSARTVILSGLSRHVARQGRPFSPLPNNIKPSVRRISFSQYRLESSIAKKSPKSYRALPNPDTTQSTQAPRRRPLWLRASKVLLFSFLALTVGFTMTASSAIPTIQDIVQPPTDAETLQLYSPDSDVLAEIDDYILNHPLTLSLMEDPKYIPARAHLKIPAKLRPHNLTGGTLLGEDKIAVPPLSFSTKDGSSFVSMQHLGHALCGHPGIVHGGLLATLLDEGLARCCFPALPNKVGVTASLKIDYRKPCMADQYVVLRAETTKVEGRKAWVKGWLETLPGPEGWSKGEEPVVLVEAEALFIEPKQAATMARVYSTQ